MKNLTVYDILMESGNRLSCGSRWLCLDKLSIFTVYERKPYAKKTTVLYDGLDENEACSYLVEERD